MLESICFKIGSKQIRQIDDLVRDDFFFSRAEIFRASIIHFVKTKIKYPGVSWNSSWEEDTAYPSKDSVSTKLPPGLLKIMDELVLEKDYKSRSAFIREAVDSFLVYNEPIFNEVET